MAGTLWVGFTFGVVEGAGWAELGRGVSVTGGKVAGVAGVVGVTKGVITGVGVDWSVLAVRAGCVALLTDDPAWGCSGVGPQALSPTASAAATDTLATPRRTLPDTSFPSVAFEMPHGS
ncbi:hypothetical protein ACOCJ7_05365 [Knoellia sp. CPCC 206453]|uniref:hypothetical protein n=1 Tax=Knoellia pratensis TaxID=3404796 RepID=UPI00361A8CA2